MTSSPLSLTDLGWSAHFATQLQPDDLASLLPARIVAVHRDRIHVLGEGLDALTVPYDSSDEEGRATVGDWLLLEIGSLRPKRLLARTSVFRRRAAGTSVGIQLIAANVDTLFVMTSCNQDFNLPRLERYLAMANEAAVTPVVLLTKSDLADDPGAFAQAARALMPDLAVEMIDARDANAAARLSPWCRPGQMIALAGSSGVGKSTLANTMLGAATAATQGIRTHDDKGRHTTSVRRMHRLANGAWLLDLPGMREIQLADVKAGVEDVFADLVDLAASCRFSNCRHVNEPGCAVRAALEAGTIGQERVQRWQKLSAEEACNTETLSVRRARERSFGKMAKKIMKAKQEKFED
jgi:ribosome biogenesis GTPase